MHLQRSSEEKTEVMRRERKMSNFLVITNAIEADTKNKLRKKKHNRGKKEKLEVHCL